MSHLCALKCDALGLGKLPVVRVHRVQVSIYNLNSYYVSLSSSLYFIKQHNSLLCLAVRTSVLVEPTPATS
jgi:hypothetical protein